MKTTVNVYRQLSAILITAAILALAAGTAQAASVTKKDTTTMQANTTDWSVAPGTTDIGVFDNTISLANEAALTLGGNLSIGALQFNNNLNGPVAIGYGASQTLTLNSSGTALDMSAANQDVTLNCLLTLGASQTWNVGASRTLTVGGAISGSSYSLTKSGVGTLTLSGTGNANTFSSLTLSAGQLGLNGSTNNVSGTGTFSGSTTLTLTNGGVINFGGRTYWNGSSATMLIGSNSVFNGGTNEVDISSAGSQSSNQVVVNGGVFTNSATLIVGYAAGSVGNALVITNGGSVYRAGAKMYIGYAGANSNNVTVTGTGSTFYGGGQEIDFGYGAATNNVMTVTSGGVVTNTGWFFLGYSSGAAGNGLVITNGGQFVGQTDRAGIGFASGANSNTVTVTDPGSKWDLNGKEIRISDSGPGNGNMLTVTSGGVVTNTGAITVGYFGGSVGDSLVITNGGQVFTTNSLNLDWLSGTTGTTNNTVIVTGTNSVTGAPSLLNMGASTINISLHTGFNNVMTVSSGGVVTNAGGITIGWWGAKGSGMVITNGGQFFSRNRIFFGGPDGSGASSNTVTVTGVGSLWNLGGGEMDVGYATSSNHTVTVSSGGVVTNVGFIFIGYGAGDTGNSLVITNGGQVFSTGNNAAIGRVAGVNSNSVSIGGALNGTNALWNLVGHTLTIGGTGATGNWMTVSSGGVLTNVSTLTINSNNCLNVYGGTVGMTTLAMTGNAQIGVNVSTQGVINVSGTATLSGTVAVSTNSLPKTGVVNYTILTCGSLAGPGLIPAPLPENYSATIMTNGVGPYQIVLRLSGPSKGTLLLVY